MRKIVDIMLGNAALAAVVTLAMLVVEKANPGHHWVAVIGSTGIMVALLSLGTAVVVIVVSELRWWER